MSDNRPNVYYEGSKLIIRASAFGGCIGSLVRCGLGMTPEPPPKTMVEKWEEGNVAEPQMVDELRARGMVITEDGENQRTYELACGPVVIRCHPDGIMWEGDKRDRVLEFKALSPGFNRSFPPYLWQASIEMAATGLPLLWVYGTKHDGVVSLPDLELVEVDEPYYSLTDIKKRALEIYKGVRDAEIPQCDWRQFPCGYWKDDEAECGKKKWTKEQVEDLGLPEDVWKRYLVAKDVKAAADQDFAEAQEHIKAILKDRPGENYRSGKLRFTKVKGSRRLDTKKVKAAGVDLGPYYTKGKDYWRIDVESSES